MDIKAILNNWIVKNVLLAIAFVVVLVTLVSVLLAYFPFSKLTHMAGVFFSPTRNLPCDTRRTRHENPWNPEKNFLTYPEYEDMYREAMADAGLPLDKPLEKKSGE